MRHHTIRELMRVAEYAVGSQQSLNPGPYKNSRNRIEDDNGNEVFREEAAAYINDMQALVPSLLKALDFLLTQTEDATEY